MRHKGRILVVEEDVDVSKMLRIYFDSQGYEALMTNRCDDASNICRTKLPKVVLLGRQLPDADNFSDSLHSNAGTQHIPVLHLTKPFDIEELKQRVETVITSGKNLSHPITNLPTGKLIEEQLKQAKDKREGRVSLFCSIRNIAGSPSVNEIIVLTADIILETVARHGHKNDFVGQPADYMFIILTTPDAAPIIRKVVSQRFNDQLGGRAELSWQ